MKKAILSIAGVLTLAVMLVSCKGGNPKATAEKFLNGFYHMDYASAKEVSTDDTKKQLESFESIMGTMSNQSAKDEAKKIKITVMEPKVTGDNATVEYTTDKDPTPRNLKLVKQNGKWMAQWSKMDMGGGMGNGGATTPGTDINNNNNGAGMNNGGMSATPDTISAPPAEGTMNNNTNEPMNNGAGTTPNR